MKTIAMYIIEVVISSGILYGYYHFFLRNKRFHQYNRFYLLLAAVICICIPFLRIPVYFNAEEAKPILLKSLMGFSSDGFDENLIVENGPVQNTWFTWKKIPSALYLFVFVFLFSASPTWCRSSFRRRATSRACRPARAFRWSRSWAIPASSSRRRA